MLDLITMSKVYLNTTLHKLMDMKQVYGCNHGDEDHVLLFSKALYGLKKS